MPHLLRQRWFGGKARELETARFADWALVRAEPRPVFLTVVEAVYLDGSREYYQLPLTLVSESAAAAIAMALIRRRPSRVFPPSARVRLAPAPYSGSSAIWAV